MLFYVKMNDKIWTNEKGYIVKGKEKVKMDSECEVIEHLYKSCLGKYFNTPLCIEIHDKYKKCYVKNKHNPLL